MPPKQQTQKGEASAHLDSHPLAASHQTCSHPLIGSLQRRSEVKLLQTEALPDHTDLSSLHYCHPLQLPFHNYNSFIRSIITTPSSPPPSSHIKADISTKLSLKHNKLSKLR